MANKLTEYQKGYLDGLKDKPKKKAAVIIRDIKPELLAYPADMRDLKTAYAIPRDWGKLRKHLSDSKEGGCEIVMIAFPEILGDNYIDVVCYLSLIAESGLFVAIAKKSPFLVEWAENFPIFKVPKKY